VLPLALRIDSHVKRGIRQTIRELFHLGVWRQLVLRLRATLLRRIRRSVWRHERVDLSSSLLRSSWSCRSVSV
jgi:hypothetical protein